MNRSERFTSLRPKSRKWLEDYEELFEIEEAEAPPWDLADDEEHDGYSVIRRRRAFDS